MFYNILVIYDLDFFGWRLRMAPRTSLQSMCLSSALLTAWILAPGGCMKGGLAWIACLCEWFAGHCEHMEVSFDGHFGSCIGGEEGRRHSG